MERTDEHLVSCLPRHGPQLRSLSPARVSPGGFPELLQAFIRFFLEWLHRLYPFRMFPVSLLAGFPLPRIGDQGLLERAAVAPRTRNPPASADAAGFNPLNYLDGLHVPQEYLPV